MRSKYRTLLLSTLVALTASACGGSDPVAESEPLFISRLVDNNGAPVVGVTVAINGIEAPARTDANGRFVLPADFRNE